MEADAASTSSFVANMNRKFQQLLDRSSPHIMPRWIGTAVLLLCYFFRIWAISEWEDPKFVIVTYGLAIYILNQFIGFISPQFDPDDSELDGGLPTTDSEEFRPFARRVPEFKFWFACTRSIVVSFFMTFFPLFDIPAFWPILVIYFLVLFFITMKRQINHMIKHKYVPISFGKPTFSGGGGGLKNNK